MPGSHTPARRRFLVAVIASFLLVLSGPYIGQFRSAIRTALPAGTYVVVLNGVLLGLATLIGVAAVRRIRTHRSLLLVVAGLIVAAAGARLYATAAPNSSQSAVERFHFVEYGVITWLYYRGVAEQLRSNGTVAADPSLILRPVFYALLVGIADEWFQWFVPERIGEWPDVLLNGNAVAAGLLCSLGVDTPAGLQWRWHPGTKRAVATALALLVLASAAFLHAIHLGHVIDDPRIGKFSSRYTGPELLELSRDRVVRWQASPPPTVVRRLSREDQYLAEAVWHVQARNSAWELDPAVAWRENLILERYFDPALDTTSYAMPVSRWDRAQRADAERRAGATPDVAFESHAARLPLYYWPPLLIWGMAAGVALYLRTAR
ncbi:MAG: VanZ family protein [Vicinamibacterales bacterium]